MFHLVPQEHYSRLYLFYLINRNFKQFVSLFFQDPKILLKTVPAAAPTPTQQMSEKERLARLQDEVMSIQLKYQRELEKYEKENKELKKQLLLQREKLRGGKIRKIKVNPGAYCAMDLS